MNVARQSLDLTQQRLAQIMQENKDRDKTISTLQIDLTNAKEATRQV